MKPDPDFDHLEYLCDQWVETLCAIQATHVVTLTPPQRAPGETNYSDAMLKAQLRGWEALFNRTRLGPNWKGHPGRVEGFAALARAGTVPCWKVIVHIPGSQIGIHKAIRLAWRAVVPGGEVSTSPVADLEQAIRDVIEIIEIEDDLLSARKYLEFF